MWIWRVEFGKKVLTKQLASQKTQLACKRVTARKRCEAPDTFWNTQLELLPLPARVWPCLLACDAFPHRRGILSQTYHMWGFDLGQAVLPNEFHEPNLLQNGSGLAQQFLSWANFQNKFISLFKYAFLRSITLPALHSVSRSCVPVALFGCHCLAWTAAQLHMPIGAWRGLASIRRMSEAISESRLCGRLHYGTWRWHRHCTASKPKYKYK